MIIFDITPNDQFLDKERHHQPNDYVSRCW